MFTQQQAIADLQELKEKLHAKHAFLFGSVARNEQHELSDVDVIFVKETGKRFHLRIGEVLDTYTGVLPLEPLVYTPEEFERLKDKPALKEMLGRSVEV